MDIKFSYAVPTNTIQSNQFWIQFILKKIYIGKLYLLVQKINIAVSSEPYSVLFVCMYIVHWIYEFCTFWIKHKNRQKKYGKYQL